MQRFGVKVCAAAMGVFIAGPVMAGHWVMPVVDNPPQEDAFGAYRTTLGTPVAMRCAVVRQSDQHILSTQERQALYPGVSFFLRQDRGSATLGGAGLWQPYTVQFVDAGVHVFSCDAANPAVAVLKRTTTVVADALDIKANDLLVDMLSAQNEAVDAVGVGQPVQLRIKAFKPGRTGVWPPTVSSVSWSAQAAPCDRAPSLLPAGTLRTQPLRPWSQAHGLLQEHVFSVPGTYHACARIASGTGEVIGKAVSLRVDANAKPTIETLWNPQVNFGVFDARSGDRQQGLASTYPVRVLIKDDNPGTLAVTFGNQSGTVVGTLSSTTQGQAVYQAQLPFAEGLQIVGVRVTDGSHVVHQTTSFLATRQMLTAYDTQGMQGARKGAVAYVTHDVLEDSVANPFAPQSLEASFKALPVETRRQLMPSISLIQEVPVPVGISAGRLPAGTASGMMLEVRGSLVPQDLRLDLTRGPAMKAHIEADFKLDVALRCFVRAYARAKIPQTCPFSINGRLGVSADLKMRIGTEVAVRRDSVSGEALLAFNWDGATVDRSVTVKPQVARSGERLVHDTVRALILAQTSQGSLGRTLFKCTGAGRHCQPGAPLSSMVVQGKTWIGVPLTQEGRLQASFEVPHLFTNKSSSMSYRSALLDLSLAGDHARLALGGALLPSDLGTVTAAPSYARATFGDDSKPWPTHQDLLPATVLNSRVPQPNVGLALHVDTLNAMLAGFVASGGMDLDLSAPEFAALVAGVGSRQADESAAQHAARQAQAVSRSPLAALAHMPRGRVTLKFERAPRVAPRRDLSEHLALELGPMLLTVDLRQDAASLVTYRLTAIAGIQLDVAQVTGLLPRGIAVVLPKTSCLRAPLQLTPHCQLILGLEVLERTGFSNAELLPALATPQLQQALLTQWQRLQKTLGFISPLSSSEGPRLDASEQALAMRNVFSLAFLPPNPGATEPDPLSVSRLFPYVLPERAIPLTGPLIDALRLPINAEHRAAIKGLRPHPELNGMGAFPGWLGFVGQVEREVGSDQSPGNAP